MSVIRSVFQARSQPVMSALLGPIYFPYPSLLSLTFLFLPSLPFLSLFPYLRGSGHQFELGGLWSAVSLSNGVRGGGPGRKSTFGISRVTKCVWWQPFGYFGDQNVYLNQKERWTKRGVSSENIISERTYWYIRGRDLALRIRTVKVWGETQIQGLPRLPGSYTCLS